MSKWLPLALVRDLLLFRPKAYAVVKRAHIPAFKCWIGRHNWVAHYAMWNANEWVRAGNVCSNCGKKGR